MTVVAIIVGSAVIVGLIFVYEKTKTVNTAMPVEEERKIEADFDEKKKQEATRIAALDQEELLADLSHHKRPGG